MALGVALVIVVVAARCWARLPNPTLHLTMLGLYYTQISGNGSEPEVKQASWDDVDLGTCGCRLPDACYGHIHLNRTVLQFDAGCPSGMRYCCNAQEKDQTVTVRKPGEGYNGTETMLLERVAKENKLMEDSMNPVNNETKQMEASTKYRNGHKDYTDGSDGSAHEVQTHLISANDLLSPWRQKRETHDTVHKISAMEDVHKEMPYNVSLEVVESNNADKDFREDENDTLVTSYKLSATESSAQPFLRAETVILITATQGETVGVKHANESEAAIIKTIRKSQTSQPIPGPSKLSDINRKSCFNISANTTCITPNNLDVSDDEIPAEYDYQSVDLFSGLDRDDYEMDGYFSFLNFNGKGFSYFTFYWSYVFALIYAVCYLISFIITENSILSIIFKVTLAQFAPYIVRQPIFAVGDLLLSWIFDKII